MPDRVLTTHRDIDECIDSLIRMGWVNNNACSITEATRKQKYLYEYWHARSDYEVEYEKLVSEPEREIVGIGNTLGIAVNNAEAERIADELSRLTPPKDGGYDPVTLLHPHHRGKWAESIKYCQGPYFLYVFQ